MGLGSTIKNILGDEKDDRASSNNASPISAQRTEDFRLPAGTGPGTSGKPAPGGGVSNTTSNKSYDNNTSGGINTSRSDTDASRGGLDSSRGISPAQHTGTHNGVNTGVHHTRIHNGANTDSHGTYGDSAGCENVTGSRTGDFTEPHSVGHIKAPSDEIMPDGNAQEDSKHLKHVTHDHVRHVEVEEVERQKEHDRHVHHVQHHVQPIHHRDEREEQHHHNIHPVTQVREKHASKDEDVAYLHNQVGEHRDTTVHGAKEREVIDKGTVVNENVHHHVHHVIQPVIERETVDKHRIHTVIPSHEVTHEAPIVHQSKVHAPISFDQFKPHPEGVAHEQVAHNLMNDGECTREVDGIGEKLAQKLHLGPADPADRQRRGYSDSGLDSSATGLASNNVGQQGKHGAAGQARMANGASAYSESRSNV